jgi:LacI family transcriptional regulator
VKNKVIRIKDIALKAQVSTGTVDRVLHKRGRVSEDVEERVLKIIKELNYEPNMMARALGSNKSCRIATLVPDSKLDDYWEAPVAGIEKAERDFKQYGVVVEQYVFDNADTASYKLIAEELTRSAPDGILLAPVFYRETLPFFERWKASKIPFVLFNTQIEEYSPLSYIGQDSYQSGILAGKLIHYGQPDPCSILITHIDEDISNSAHLIEKEQGLKDYFYNNQLSNYHIFKVELDRADMEKFTNQLDEIVQSNPELRHIFVTTSKAHGIATYLEQRNISHIKIIGYDLMPRNLHYLNNGLISFLINQNPKGQGYWGISHLVNYIVFKKQVPHIKYLPLDIVTRENLNYFIEEEPDFVAL